MSVRAGTVSSRDGRTGERESWEEQFSLGSAASAAVGGRVEGNAGSAGEKISPGFSCLLPPRAASVPCRARTGGSC